MILRCGEDLVAPFVFTTEKKITDTRLDEVKIILLAC